MLIPKNDFKDALRRNMIELLESKRGIQTALANAIDENASYFSQIKRGNPVNAMHLKAVSIVFGPEKVLELLEVENVEKYTGAMFRDETLGRDITNRLLELERISPKAFEMVATYITGAHESAKAISDRWEGIERRSKERRGATKQELGFGRKKNGTDE